MEKITHQHYIDKTKDSMFDKFLQCFSSAPPPQMNCFLINSPSKIIKDTFYKCNIIHKDLKLNENNSIIERVKEAWTILEGPVIIHKQIFYLQNGDDTKLMFDDFKIMTDIGRKQFAQKYDKWQMSIHSEICFTNDGIHYYVTSSIQDGTIKWMGDLYWCPLSSDWYPFFVPEGFQSPNHQLLSDNLYIEELVDNYISPFYRPIYENEIIFSFKSFSKQERELLLKKFDELDIQCARLQLGKMKLCKFSRKWEMFSTKFNCDEKTIVIHPSWIQETNTYVYQSTKHQYFKYWIFQAEIDPLSKIPKFIEDPWEHGNVRGYRYYFANSTIRLVNDKKHIITMKCLKFDEAHEIWKNMLLKNNVQIRTFHTPKQCIQSSTWIN